MATHSSLLAWRIPWTEEPGGLQPTGSQTVGHGWAAERQHRAGLTVSCVCRGDHGRPSLGVSEPASMLLLCRFARSLLAIFSHLLCLVETLPVSQQSLDFSAAFIQGQTAQLNYR